MAGIFSTPEWRTVWPEAPRASWWGQQKQKKKRQHKAAKKSGYIHVKCRLLYCSWKVEYWCISGTDPKQRWRQFSIAFQFNQKYSPVTASDPVVISWGVTPCGQCCEMHFKWLTLSKWFFFVFCVYSFVLMLKWLVSSWLFMQKHTLNKNLYCFFPIFAFLMFRLLYVSIFWISHSFCCRAF